MVDQTGLLVKKERGGERNCGRKKKAKKHIGKDNKETHMKGGKTHMHEEKEKEKGETGEEELVGAQMRSRWISKGSSEYWERARGWTWSSTRLGTPTTRSMGAVVALPAPPLAPAAAS